MPPQENPKRAGTTGLPQRAKKPVTSEYHNRSQITDHRKQDFIIIIIIGFLLNKKSVIGPPQGPPWGSGAFLAEQPHGPSWCLGLERACKCMKGNRLRSRGVLVRLWCAVVPGRLFTVVASCHCSHFLGVFLNNASSRIALVLPRLFWSIAALTH